MSSNNHQSDPNLAEEAKKEKSDNSNDPNARMTLSDPSDPNNNDPNEVRSHRSQDRGDIRIERVLNDPEYEASQREITGRMQSFLNRLQDKN